MQRLPDVIECPRLVLRRWRPEDAARLSAAVAASLEHLRPWMPWVAFEPVSAADRRTLIEQWEVDWAAGGDAVYGAFADGEVVGGCGLHRRIGPGGLEIGYWIHVDHVRLGYAAELAAGLTTAAFTVTDIERVEIHHDVANEPSRGVPKRLGFTLDREAPDGAVAPGEIGIEAVWSMSRAEWRRRLDADA